MCDAVRRSAKLPFGVLLVAAVLVVTGSEVYAEFIGPIVTVTATSDHGSASRQFALPDAASDRAKFVLEERLQLRGQGGELIAAIEDLSIEVDGDPLVNVDFAVSAGGTATTFEISSAVVSFWPLEDVTGFASAGITLTDGTPRDGASLGLVSGWNGLYRATYNGSNVFAELLDAQNISSSVGTDSWSEDSGVLAIPGLVSSIKAAYSFRLSANDYASGTSQFEIVGTTSDIPEPSMLAMIGFGLAALILRVRRR
jgi:hypothetical protein